MYRNEVIYDRKNIFKYRYILIAIILLIIVLISVIGIVLIKSNKNEKTIANNNN